MFRVFLVKIAFITIISALNLLYLAFPCTAAEKPLSVYVVNYPLKYFAERIGGSHVKVTFPVSPDIDPVYWKPSISDIGDYQKADLILLNGAGYAKWVRTVSLPRARTIDTSRSFKDRYITAMEITTHSHGQEGEHAHEGLAFTTWLDFTLAAKHAEAVYLAFSRKRPDLKSKFKANYESLQNDLLVLNDRLKEIVARKPKTRLLFSHPVYDYLTKGYGIYGKSVHWEPDQNPTADQINELILILKDHQSNWMVWEGDPIQASVEALKEMGIHSIVYDPCGNVPDSGDFMSVMEQNVSNLEVIFK